MKKIRTQFLLLAAFSSNAQESFFNGNNNYVAPAIPSQASAIVTSDLVLNLDTGNPASYLGTESW